MLFFVKQSKFLFVCVSLCIPLVLPSPAQTNLTKDTLPERNASLGSNSNFSGNTGDAPSVGTKKKYYTRPLAADDNESLKMVENVLSSVPHSGQRENSTITPTAKKEYQANEGNRTLRVTAENDDTPADQSAPSVGLKQKGPFSVQIEDKKFYGGLVTYIHHLHPARICRVLNACIRHDGTLVLPRWMQRHDNLLSFHCGQKKLEFSAEDGSPPASLKELDLVGLSLPRPSVPDFVRDFMPNAVVFDLIYGDRDVTTSCHSRKGSSCESFPSLKGGIKTAVFLPPRLEALEQKQSWVREFIKLMKPPNSGKQAKVLYNYPDAEEEAGMQCFRSAFFTRGPFSKYHIMNDHLQDLNFLKAHGISKAARRLGETDSENLTSCHMNITISNRKVRDDDPEQLVGRYITNIPSLRTEIMKQADRVPGLNVHVATITLEGKSLWWQINAMQKTDIWVAGHGPLLTNMLFMRQNSTLIEIQPFAYYPQVYERIAQHLAHVNYDRYIAHPDEEAFETCISQTYPQSHGSYNEVRTLHDRFLRASKKFFQSDSTHSLVLHTLEGRGLDYVRACARMQRLTTNARNFAIAIVRQARIRCGLPPPKAGEREAQSQVNLTI